MDENKQMLTYKNGLWSKIKQTIKKLFSKKSNSFSNSSITEVKNIQEHSKEEFMKIYNSVKSNTIDLESLDKKTLYKIMLLLKEEMDLLDKKLSNAFNETDIHLYNLKMYTKEIELLNKNV